MFLIFHLLYVLSVCGRAKADIVFLVDESSSIGVNNFIKMKDFIFRVATYFPNIGPQGAQVRLSHAVLLLWHTRIRLWSFGFLVYLSSCMKNGF